MARAPTCSSLLRIMASLRERDSCGPYVDSVRSDEQMPAATSVVIIGGGIIGTLGGAVAGCARHSCRALREGARSPASNPAVTGGGVDRPDATSARCR